MTPMMYIFPFLSLMQATSQGNWPKPGVTSLLRPSFVSSELPQLAQVWRAYVGRFKLEHTLPAHQFLEKCYYWLAASLEGLCVTTKYFF